MELRRQSLQKASDGIEDGSKYSLQEASGSKTPGSDTVPTLQRGAATKASGPLEAASSSNNNTSGQRKVMKKLPPPPISTKSRPAPPPPPRAVSQCAQPATSRPPRPPPPSQKKLDVEGVKSSPKHNEQKASKDGSSRGSGHPQKCRSDLRTKKEYPKELNPFEFDVDISLPSNEKTSNCDLTPDLNPLSEEYNDEQGSSNKGDAVSCDVKRGDNTKCSSKNNEQKASKDGSNRGSGHPQKCHSELKTRKEYPKELNPFESDVDISLPSSEKTSTCDFPPEVNSYSKEYSDEHGYSNEGDSISSCCDVKQGDNAKSLSKNNEQKASKDGSIRGSGHSQKCRSDLETKKEYPKELNPFESRISLPSSEKTSNYEEYNDEQEGDTINCDVKQGDNEHSKTPGKPTATQEEECSPYSAMPEAPIASGNTSNHVQPVGSSPSGKEAVVQREESTPNTAVPEVSTSDGETSTHVQPWILLPLVRRHQCSRKKVLLILTCRRPQPLVGTLPAM